MNQVIAFPMPAPQVLESLIYIGVYADSDTGPRTLEVVFTSDNSEGERAFSAQFSALDGPMEVFAALSKITQQIFQRYANHG